ncbi:MAG: RdgB/HAM1 family non-canonical purine NTP pyrophosphatase [Acidimicrobiales bacterium]
MTLELVLATANPDKAAEMRMLLSAADVSLSPRPPSVPEVPEEEDTLLGNARAKAWAISGATGRPAVADDTGLFVAALGGAPGVRSARYAGEDVSYADNVETLLGAMSGREDRRAEFRTVAIVAFPGGHERWVEGVARGTIATSARGEQGFGYDPIFVPDRPGGLTYAELGTAAKNACSQRAAAFSGLVPLLALDTLP